LMDRVRSITCRWISPYMGTLGGEIGITIPSFLSHICSSNLSCFQLPTRTCWGWWSSGFWWSNQVCTDCFTSYVAFHSQQTDDEDNKLYVQMLFAQFSFSSFLILVFSLGSKTSRLLRPSSHFLISRTYAGGVKKTKRTKQLQLSSKILALLTYWLA
jgi:hypothetical protein